VNYAIDLRLVSDLVGAPMDELEALNPSLLHMATPPEASYDLHLPAGAAALFDQRVSLIPEAKRNSWRYHLVAAGDTIDSVAHEFRVQPTELAQANQLTPSDNLQGLEAVAVPVAPAAAPSTRMVLYTARRGDTLVTIADRFGVSLAQLRRWNNVAGTQVSPGRRIHVAEPIIVRHATGKRRRAASASRSAAPGSKGSSTVAATKASATKKQHAAAAKTASRSSRRRTVATK
jgi:membrane-bound lytic murein transglycosylase D